MNLQRAKISILLLVPLSSCVSSKSHTGKNQPKSTVAAQKLTKDDIEKVVRNNISQVVSCMKLGSSDQGATEEGTQDKVDTLFTVKGSGDVTHCKVVETTFSKPEVGDCICAAISKWKFPNRSSTESVRYPFAFLHNTRSN